MKPVVASTAAVLLAASTPASAIMNNFFLFTAIPTLDEVGLGVLIALVAAVAGWVVRKRTGRK
ncbi:MAG: IPTL-CTERM sorting domain-containing protein [Betaproteobacteria bacterium]